MFHREPIGTHKRPTETKLGPERRDKFVFRRGTNVALRKATNFVFNGGHIALFEKEFGPARARTILALWPKDVLGLKTI